MGGGHATGKIAVERLYCAHDCGMVINPRIVEGQLIGGCVQGLGAVLGEELVYDRDGHLQNTGFGDYLIPQAGDVPPVEIGHLVSPSPNTPLGTKGMGEGGPVGVPPALVAAVEDALAPFGVTVSDPPLTPERVLGLIDAARNASCQVWTPTNRYTHIFAGRIERRVIRRMQEDGQSVVRPSVGPTRSIGPTGAR